MINLQYHGEGGSEHVQYRPLKSLGEHAERFLASLRFEQREKLEQLEVEIASFDN